MRRTISSASLTVLAYILIFNDFWFIRNPMEPEGNKLLTFISLSPNTKDNIVQIFF